MWAQVEFSTWDSKPAANGCIKAHECWPTQYSSRTVYAMHEQYKHIMLQGIRISTTSCSISLSWALFYFCFANEYYLLAKKKKKPTLC